MDGKHERLARVDEKYRYLIDSDGNKVEFGDPRVVHVFVFSATASRHLTKMMQGIFERRGWRFRAPEGVSPESLQRARRLCSGKECFPCLGATGVTMLDFEKREDPNEITIYHNHDEDIGNCQFAGWPVVWDTFAKRLGTRNVLFFPRIALINNYLGQGTWFSVEGLHAIVAGDLLDEAEGVLRCLARDPKTALEVFEDATARVTASIRKGVFALHAELARWAETLAAIPLRAPVRETPKVFLFGGLNLRYIHHPLTDYFFEEGIIPKSADMFETVCFGEAMHVIRYAFKQGLLDPEEQLKAWPLLASALERKADRPGARFALRSLLNLTAAGRIMGRLHRIAKRSGLIYGEIPRFEDIHREGHKLASFNALTETSLTAGSFVVSVKSGIYDGYVNATAFNCQASVNAQALIRPMGNNGDVPYISIDLEGPWISANQRRLLETVAVRARRLREEKNRLAA